MNARTIRTPADIKGMVDNGKQVRFTRFQSGQLWYATECGFEFPVALEDVGETPYPAQDKAMLFLRFIRKHVQMIQASLAEADQPAVEPSMVGRPLH